MDYRQKIEQLKKERDAVILAHYYVSDEVQEIADYIGDSYYLSKLATELKEKTIVLCGVHFMAESAKLLNPEKTVLLPAPDADCPMAHMVDIDKINYLRTVYEDLAVVCYINSTAEIKCFADVCVTSSNAERIVRRLPNKHIFFIPDEHLGRHIATKIPEKEFIFNDGFCHVHAGIRKEEVIKAKEANPNALLLAHPECKEELLTLADYIGSTSEIISYATNSVQREFIICTEVGVFYQLKKKNPDKKFYAVNSRQLCANMKKIDLKKIYDCLEHMEHAMYMEQSWMQKANEPLVRMLELAEK